MGRDAHFYCRDCKKNYYLGYGSNGTWLDSCKSVAEFDEYAAKTDNGELSKNVNMRQCLLEHEGHTFETHSGDWTYIKDGVLYGEFGPMGAGVPLIENIAEYEQIDLYSDEYSPPPEPIVYGSTGKPELDRKLAAWEARKQSSQ